MRADSLSLFGRVQQELRAEPDRERSTLSQSREKELFELLIREHATSLRVVLRAALHDSSCLDELFQETLVRAWDALPRFDRERDFGKWLRGIARNVLREREAWRARAATPVGEELLEVIESHCEDFQRQRHDTLGDELGRLNLCLERLPEHFREAVEHRYRAGSKGRAWLSVWAFNSRMSRSACSARASFSWSACSVKRGWRAKWNRKILLAVWTSASSAATCRSPVR
jgi:RNA polymerase sigma-70 factor (ECF subfamily)